MNALEMYFNARVYGIAGVVDSVLVDVQTVVSTWRHLHQQLHHTPYIISRCLQVTLYNRSYQMSNSCHPQHHHSVLRHAQISTDFRTVQWLARMWHHLDTYRIRGVSVGGVPSYVHNVLYKLMFT